MCPDKPAVWDYNPELLRSKDIKFVELVQADLQHYLKDALIDRVLLFPPVDSYHRLLIHRTAEEYPSLHTFSIGDGNARRTVVCLQEALKRERYRYMTTPRPLPARGRGRGRLQTQENRSPDVSPSSSSRCLVGPETKRVLDDTHGEVDRHATPGISKTASSAGGVVRGRRLTQPDGENQDRPVRSKPKKPEVAIYVPRAKRLQQEQLQRASKLKNEVSGGSNTHDDDTRSMRSDIVSNQVSCSVDKTNSYIRIPKKEVQLYVRKNDQDNILDSQERQKTDSIDPALRNELSKVEVRKDRIYDTESDNSQKKEIAKFVNCDSFGGIHKKCKFDEPRLKQKHEAVGSRGSFSSSKLESDVDNCRLSPTIHTEKSEITDECPEHVHESQFGDEKSLSSDISHVNSDVSPKLKTVEIEFKTHISNPTPSTSDSLCNNSQSDSTSAVLSACLYSQSTQCSPTTPDIEGSISSSRKDTRFHGIPLGMTQMMSATVSGESENIQNILHEHHSDLPQAGIGVENTALANIDFKTSQAQSTSSADTSILSCSDTVRNSPQLPGLGDCQQLEKQNNTETTNLLDTTSKKHFEYQTVIREKIVEEDCSISNDVIKKCSEVNDEGEDSWDNLFNDDGDSLDPLAIDELTSTVGKVKIQKPKINYLDYSPKDPDFNFEEYGHVIEVFDFPTEFTTRDLIAGFQTFLSKGLDVKWVDDTHALLIFSSSIAARDALETVNPLLKVRPLSEATRASKVKAKRCPEFLQPYKPRPETTASAARRLVSGALGLTTRITREQRETERRKLKEAKEKKKRDRKDREDMWEGRIGNCAMDES
ncbi:hypothetical protein ScPMuIL_006753 [Solemya velum]